MEKCKVISIDGVDYIRADQAAKMVAPDADGKQYCIVRTRSAGVFAGWYDRTIKGAEGTVFQARRLWYWDGAASLSQLAIDGTSKPSKCKFPAVVPEVDIKEIIEVLPCSEKAQKSIEGVSVWQA